VRSVLSCCDEELLADGGIWFEQELRSLEEELSRAQEEQKAKLEQINLREKEVSAREFKVLKRELQLMIDKQNQAQAIAPQPKKRHGKPKRSKLKLLSKERGQNISAPSGTPTSFSKVPFPRLP